MTLFFCQGHVWKLKMGECMLGVMFNSENKDPEISKGERLGGGQISGAMAVDLPLGF